jgi:hypothetical protein
MSNSFYDEASWVLIPEGIKEDVVYAQKPTDGLGDLTFTRASDATRTNSAGVIERTPWNFFQDSEMFSTANWGKLNSSVSANTTTAPNGTLTADTLVENTANSTHIALQITAGQISGNTYTASIYAKAAGRSWIGLFNNAGGTGNAFFDLSNGTVGTVLTGSAQIQSVGNGWYRCSITFVPTTTGTFNIQVRIASADNVPTYTGNGTSGIFIWGAQIVEGTDAKPYFATTNRQDVPRLDYRNADGTVSTCPRLLLEPQRTNLVPNGVLFNSSTGVSYDSTVTASPAPGVQNATRITKNEAAGNVRYANQNASATLLAGSSVYTLSRYFKYDGFDFQTTMEYNNAGNWGGVSWTVPINISSTSITIGTPTACTATIVNMGSGWYRVTATITTGAIPVGFPTYLMRLPSTLSTGQGFLTALPQLELGAYATTFIPTTTAAVTRIADAASKTGVSSLIGQTEGTLFVDITLTSRSSFSYFAIAPNLGATNTYIGIGISASSISFEVVNSGIQVAYSFPNTSTGSFKLAFAYKANDFVAYVNGALVHTDTSGTVPTCSQIGLNAYNNAASWNYNQAALFPTRLTNAQLAQLTTL